MIPEREMSMAKRKNRRKKTNQNSYLPLVIGGLVLMVLAIAGVYAFDGAGASPQGEEQFTFPPVEVDQPSPDLTLRDLEGNQVSLSDFRGKVVLLNNWATWCPPCKEEMPVFNEYYNTYRDQGFEVVAVEAGDPEAQVRAFVENNEIDFTILLDPENQSLLTFQNQSLPNSFVIDRRGHLRLAWTGAINRATLDKYITPLLEE